MKTSSESSVYVSGDCVEPGLYRDVETGALVRVAQPDELPEGTRIVRYARYFHREDDAESQRVVELREKIDAQADSMTKKIIEAAEQIGRAAHDKRSLQSQAARS